MAKEPAQSNTGAPKGKKLTKNQIILIVGLSLILIAIIVVGVILYRLLNQKPVAETGRSGSYIVDESNINDIDDMIAKRVADGMFRLNMNTTWHFSTGDKPSSDAYIANAKTNHKPLFFEVTLDDTGETLYTSTVLPVGTALKELVLDTALPSGTYPATCTYNLLDEEGEIASSLAVGVSIVIKN